MGIKDNFSQAVKELWKKDGQDEQPAAPSQPSELDGYLRQSQTAPVPPVQPAAPVQPAPAQPTPAPAQPAQQAPQAPDMRCGFWYSVRPTLSCFARSTVATWWGGEFRRCQQIARWLYRFYPCIILGEIPNPYCCILKICVFVGVFW